MIRSKKLRASARNQECTLNISGVCNGNPETTVLAHISDGNGGMALKGNDTSSCFACSSCHDAIDGRIPYFQQSDNANVLDWYLRRAMSKTIVIWIESGLVCVAGHEGFKGRAAK
jgi:hypothetical protein